MTSHFVLPPLPGLERRLAYGNYVRSRQFRQRTDLWTYERLVELEDVQRGVPMSLLSSSSKLQVATGSTFCVVCQETCKEHVDVVRVLKCGHSFHMCCIDTWFINHVKCPLCGYLLV